MKLKKGVTGFWNKEDKVTGSSVYFSEVKSLSRKVHLFGSYAVINTLDIQNSNNFFSIIVLDKSQNLKFKILINPQYCYYCGTTFESEWMNLNFIELDSKIQHLFGAKLKFLSPSELNTKVTLSDLTDLSAVEIEQINYWNSKSFGEIIFNGYD